MKIIAQGLRGGQVWNYLVVSAGGVEGIGAAGEQGLVVSGDQDFDVVVALVLKNTITRRYIQQQQQKKEKRKVTGLVNHVMMW